MNADAVIAHLVEQVSISCAPDRSREWTDEELERLQEGCAGLMIDLELAIALGKSEMSVHLMRERSGIPTVRNTPGWSSANRIARRLGLRDARMVIAWVRKGLVMGRRLPQASTCWMVNEVSLRRFLVYPRNWPYLMGQWPQSDILKHIRDPRLERLVRLAQERWDDEWLTGPEAAEVAGVDKRKVYLYIHLGRLEAVKVSDIDGRQDVNAAPRWSYNFVRRSQVLSSKWDYKPGEANLKLTERGLEWIRKARRAGWSACAIARSMKASNSNVLNWIHKYLEG